MEFFSSSSSSSSQRALGLSEQVVPSGDLDNSHSQLWGVSKLGTVSVPPIWIQKVFLRAYSAKPGTFVRCFVWIFDDDVCTCVCATLWVPTVCVWSTEDDLRYSLWYGFQGLNSQRPACVASAFSAVQVLALSCHPCGNCIRPGS